jgi:UDP-3-O-[3-hydroxymyristoyl] glucosamine N-acyltransferase
VQGPIRLGDLAARLQGEIEGDPERLIRGVAALDAAGPDDLSFFTNPKYRQAAEATRAGAVLVGLETRLEGRDLLRVQEPYLKLAEILEIFHPPPPRRPGVHPDARVEESARLGDEVEVAPYAVVGADAVLGSRCTIGAGCFVGEGCQIGDDSVLMPRVVLYPGTRVGARCLIHSGVVLGSDGFGFATSGGKHRKVPQLGRVVVEDDVEIGANSAVDRGTLGDTVIGAGTKIDNLVQIGHAVRLGSDCLLAGQAGIAGSTVVGSRVTFAGQTGAAGHLEIGSGSVIFAKSAALQDLPEDSYVAGVPAIDHRVWKRVQASAKRLPELRAEVRKLQKRLAAIEAGEDSKEE